jgi:porphobilinogen synthase
MCFWKESSKPRPLQPVKLSGIGHQHANPLSSPSLFSSGYQHARFFHSMKALPLASRSTINSSPEAMLNLRRPRRNRKTETIRAMVEETQVTTQDLIFPLFLIDGQNKKVEVASMPGIFRFTSDLILKEIESCLRLGIRAFDIFPAVEDQFKDRTATKSYDPDFFYLRTLREIKKNFPEACIITDVAMDPYSSDGHDGLVHDGKIVNDETLDILGKMALAQAATGIDIIGPSDMMDGRVGYLRGVLDKNGFHEVSIMSYTAKYASGFYNPFRDALDSAPKFGDKKTYQMNPANRREALVEAELDTREGADFLMVKPALAYLDVIRLLKDNSALPIAAYNVSGEYSMIKAAAQKGWLDGDRVMRETLLSIKRAGADVILTYFAKEFACSK